MTDEMLNRIKRLPLTFPYADYDALRKIEPAAARSLAAVDQLPERAAQKYGLDRDRLPEMVVARWQAAKYVTQEMTTREIGKQHASTLSGLDLSLFSRYENLERPFTPGGKVMTSFCHDVFHESCHKVMFGEESEIKLFAVYNAIAEHLPELTDAELAQLIDAGKKLAKEQGDVEIIPLTQSRIKDLCLERGCRYINFFGEDTTGRLISRLCAAFNPTNPSELKVPFLMYMAFESSYALDFFLSLDCLRYTKTLYLNKDNEYQEVTDQRVKQVLRYCYILQNEYNKQYLKMVYTSLFQHIL